MKRKFISVLIFVVLTAVLIPVNDILGYDETDLSRFEYNSLSASGSVGLDDPMKWYGQTFTPVTTHYMYALKMYGYAYGSPTGTLDLYITETSSGIPTTTVLETGSIDLEDLPSSADYLYIWLDEPLLLTQDVKYAWVINSQDVDANNHYKYPGSTSSYSRGNTVYNMSSSSLPTSWSSAGDYAFWEMGSTSLITDIPDNPILTCEASNVTSTTALLNGYMGEFDGDYALSGFEYADNDQYTDSEWVWSNVFPEGTGGTLYSNFQYQLEDLEPETTYYFRAWGSIQDLGIVYGDTEEFYTTDYGEVRTNGVYDILNGSAKTSGTLLNLGEYDYAKGYVEISEYEDFSASRYLYPNPREELDVGDDFIVELTNLEPGTLYYYRAWVDYYTEVLGVGILSDCGNGSTYTFTTGTDYPTISIDEMTNNEVGDTWAIVTGTLDDIAGFEAVIICCTYGTTIDMEESTENNIGGSVVMTGVGSFEILIGAKGVDDLINVELEPSTHYYYGTKAAVWDSATFDWYYVYTYGGEFTTAPEGEVITPTPTVPGTSGYTIVKSTSVENYSEGSNGQRIKAYGALTNMGLNMSNVTVGFRIGTDSSCGTYWMRQTLTGIGSYYEIIDGLEPETTYYVQACARGTSEVTGAVMVITTGVGDEPTNPLIDEDEVKKKPTVSTIQIYEEDISYNNATLRGEVTDMGSADTVTVGFQYGKTTSLEKGFIGCGYTSGETEYSMNISSLETETQYYYQAVAMGDGTAYGSIKTFTTEAGSGGGNASLDEGENGFINWMHEAMDGWGMDNQAGHWMVMLILMIIVFAVPFIGLFKVEKKIGAVIGIILATVVFGIFLVSGMLNVWVVIALGLTAGAIIASVAIGKNRTVTS